MNALARTILTGALALVICAGCVLLGIYPYRPGDIWGWLVLIVVSAPILAAYELIGARLFSPLVGKRMGKSARIACGVVVGLVGIAVAWLVLELLRPYLTTWGA